MRKLLQTTLLSCMCMGTSMSAYANTTNYFVNGINNDYDKALKSSELLESQPGVGAVNLLHNTSQGLLPDLKEVIGQVFNVDGYYTDDGSVNSDHYIATVLRTFFAENQNNQDAIDVMVKALGIYKSYEGLQPLEASQILANPTTTLGCGPYPGDLGGTSVRLLEHSECVAMRSLNTSGTYGAKEILQALVHVDANKGEIFMSRSYATSDMNTWLTQVGDLSVNKINLACHSQGNEFCNRFATHIDGEGYGDNVKVLSVATPDNYVYGGGKYITLREDLASAFFLSSLPQNWTNYSAWLDQAWFWIAGNLTKYGDITGHGFNESYMSSGSSSKAFIVSNYIANHDALVADDCPNCFTGSELPFGYTLATWSDSDGAPDHYSSGKAKDYTFDINQSCQKVEFSVGSEVDSYIDLRTNGVLIGNDDDSGVSSGAKLIRDLSGGTYDIEITGKSLYSDPSLNQFGITITDLGECDPQDTSNVYIEDFNIGGQTSNIYLTYGQEIEMEAYQKYSGTVTNGDLPNPNVEYIFSRDMIVSPDDVVVEDDFSTIGSDDVSDLEREDYVISDDLGTGRWYVGFVADADSEILETNEGDNVEWIEVNIASGQPASSEDVYLDRVSVPETVMYVGTEYRLRARQYYTGHQTTQDLPSIKLRYYLSDDITYSSDDEYLGYDNSSIGSNDEYDSESLYWTPSNSDKGLRFIIFRADASDIIDEQDEDNNQEIIAVAILD